MTIVLNELVGSTTSTDVEFIELFGDIGLSLDGLSIIVVESDAGTSNGVIDSRFDFGTDDQIGTNGFFLAGNTSVEPTYGVTPNVVIPDNFVENSSYTIALVETSSISGSTVSGSEVVIDSLGVTDGGATDSFFFNAPVIGPDGSFLPAGGRRLVDGIDTDTAADWAFSDFFNGSDNTPVTGTGLGNGGGNGGDLTPIYEIQGASHVSPFVLNGQTVADFFATLPPSTFNITGDDVTTTGVVTAVDTNGFYLQDPEGDGNIATSDALFVFTGSAPSVVVGDSVEVAGTVAEFFPRAGSTIGTDTRHIPLTQIISPTVTVLDESLGTVDATILGSGGRVLPNANIDDDAFATYDAVNDGIDFFESVEGMLVTAQDLQAVAGTNRFGEIFAVTNQGTDASGISQRGTLNISPDDFNPEKIQIDEDTGVFNFDFPDVNTGDTLGDVTGVVSYGFGNFEIIPTVDFTSNIQSAGLQAESTNLAGTTNQLTIASYNVLNLDPNDADGDTDVADGRFDAIAQHIVNNLSTPDIIGLQEVQDNNGSDGGGITSADVTLQTLIDAIAAAGGPQYAFIDNTFIGNNVSGGQPEGNIRTAFLYNPNRVDLVDGSVQTIGSQDPGQAFNGARLPLVATFDFNGEDVTVVNNHFSSKGGSAPILGIEQDFAARQEDVTVNGSLDERQAQSADVQGFVSDALAADANANVVVLGDLNEFEFVSPVTGLEAAGLTNLSNNIPTDERYSFIFQGNSQKLDHILVSDSLESSAEIDVVHVNTEFVETDQRASDHDPVVSRFTFETASSEAVFFFSPDRDSSTGAAEDIVQFNDDGSFSTFFDGSDLGLENVSINAFDIVSDTMILLSFGQSVTIDGLGTVDDSDIVTFTADSLGENNTAGTFELYFDGSDVSLSSNSENIDALTRMADGSLLISTSAAPNISGVQGARDEDLLRFEPTSLGTNTSGTFSTYVDGSDIELRSNGEDINAVGLRGNELIISTVAGFKVPVESSNLGGPKITGRDEDAFSFTPATTGSRTSGTFGAELFFDGSQAGFTGDISALDLVIG
ncbi:MAG: endonuclease/exonuclease/phosphatase family protein [Cyanobacteria bacterium P01_A01_bin.37]